MTMTIKIFVFDYLTHETIIDSSIEVNGDLSIAEANHKAFREIFPDCQVNFVIDSDNFMMSPPLNQEKDEDSMPFDQYMDKWYSGAKESDSDLVTLERYEQEDFASRDSICC